MHSESLQRLSKSDHHVCRTCTTICHVQGNTFVHILDQRQSRSVSESGWMEKANFFSWFTNLFILVVQDLLSTGPVVLFFDDHHSHLSLKLLQDTKARHVHQRTHHTTCCRWYYYKCVGFKRLLKVTTRFACHL